MRTRTRVGRCCRSGYTIQVAASSKVEGSDALDALHERLRGAADVGIEFAPEALGSGATRHMMCTIPGGIRVEFIAPAA